MHTIKHVFAREILDSRGNPTVEVEVVVDGESFGRAAAPSGASIGKHEAAELRDSDKDRYGGQGVLHSVEMVNQKIAQEMIGKAFDQASLDDLLNKLDGTDTKKNIGANAMVPVSLAFAWAASRAEAKELYEYIGGLYGNEQFTLPIPMFNIMNGGLHANWATDIQEYMVIPVTHQSWTKHLEMGAEIYHHLESLLKDQGYSINVGNEGGFAPIVKSNNEAIDILMQVVQQAGFRLGEEIKFGFDAAASEFYNETTETYTLKKDGAIYSREQMIDWVESFYQKYPVESFEDMLAEDDWKGWTELTKRMGDKVKIIGDDLLVTHVKRILEAIEKKACNGLLVKLNQIGTLTESLNAMREAKKAGWVTIVSHRSGETEDVTIAHLAVGTGCEYFKAGAPSRGERTAKYNELLRIAEKLEKNG